MRIKTVFTGFGIALLAGIVVVAGVGGRSLDKVRIGGEMYEQIIGGKDLVADILPPPLYVIEAYLEATLALDGSKPVADVAARVKKLHADYEERREYWRTSSLNEDLRKPLLEGSHQAASEFWTAVEQDLLGAIERGDKAAATKSYARAAAAYAAHRKIVDDVVEMADKFNKSVEVAANEQGSLTFWSLVVAITAFFSVVIGGIVFMHKRIVAPILNMTEAMTAMSRGDLGVEMPAAERSDEIGDMAKALSVFRAAAIEKAQLEEEARLQRMSAEEQEKVRAEEQLRIAEERAKASSEQAKMAEAVAADRAKAAKEQAELVDALATGLQNLAEGNLKFRITAKFAANYQILCDNFNRAIEQLQNTVNTISESATNVTTATSEISLGVNDLAQRTDRQSASLERTSASMEQIAATVRQNAANAARADELATAACAIADRNGEIVSRTVEAVSRIAQSSNKISDIISVIDEIARQTNLLALNAAVEAARAGESGRGFAVVASEVRALAQRSSTAANDIKSLIEVSSTNVNEGVELVSRAGTSLTEIAESVRTVAALLTDIASASREQSQGVEHINRALTDLDQMTQQNSALVEQNAAVSRSLDDQSRQMIEQVRFFKVA